METTNQIEVYLNKGSSHLTKIILYAIIIAILCYYFYFKRGEEFNFHSFIDLLAFSAMGIVLILCIKICASIVGPALGFILGIILFLFAAYKLDEFLISKEIPLTDNVYNSIFSSIAVGWLAYHIIFAISNFRKYNLLARADFTAKELEALQTKTTPDYDFREL